MTEPAGVRALRDKYVCGYRIEFTDGGEDEAQVLHSGSLEECERVSGLVPAVAYSGPRPVKAAYFVIVPRGASNGN